MVITNQPVARAGLWNGLIFIHGCSNHKAVGCGSDVRKRIAGDKRQSGLGSGIEGFRFRRRHDAGPINAVMVGPLGRSEIDRVAHLDVSQ